MYSLIEQAWSAGPFSSGLWILVDLSVKSLVILVLANLGVLVLAKASAATRHMVWSLALVSLLALPFCSVLLPPLPVSLPVQPASAVHKEGSHPDPGPPGPTVPARAEDVLRPKGLSADTNQVPSTTGAISDVYISVPIPDWVSQIPQEDARPLFPWAAVLIGVWGTGALLILVSLGAHTLRRQRLASRSRLAQKGAWSGLFEGLAESIQLKRSVVLLESDQAVAPITWGFVRPVILLPLQARQWPAAQQRDLLLHELAHVKRCDQPIQLLAQLACALYWFNPLVWLAVRRLWIEQESACDDQVLKAGARPSDYGDLLVLIARSFHPTRGAARVAVPMARSSMLGGRIKNILEEGRNRAPTTRKGWLFTGLVVALLAFPLGCASLKWGGRSPVLTQMSYYHGWDSEASWSPDGEWLAFTSTRSGNHDIWRMPAAGGEAVQLTNDSYVERYPVWSPDGTELAFTSFFFTSSEAEHRRWWSHPNIYITR